MHTSTALFGIWDGNRLENARNSMFDALFGKRPVITSQFAEQTVVVPIGSIKPAPWNPRLISEVDLKGLKQSIIDDPNYLRIRCPLVRKATMEIYAGCQRWIAAKELGHETIPCIISDITEEEAKVRSAKDNSHHGQDNQSSNDFLREVSGIVSLATIGHGVILKNIRVSLDDEGDVMHPPKIPKSRLGDLYVLGNHRLLCGDATDPRDMGKLMQDDVADLLFTDPPYGVNYVGKTEDAMTIQNDNLGDEDTRKLVADSLRVASLKPGGAFYICSPPGISEMFFRLAIADAGYLLRQCIVWVKNHFVMGRQDYQGRHESLLYGWRDGAAHAFYGGRNQDTVWEIDRPNSGREHPTMKPVMLVARAIENSSEQGGIVLDPFGGSGTTMIACEQLNRKCRMLEIDPKYVDVIVDRWQKFTGRNAEFFRSALD